MKLCLYPIGMMQSDDWTMCVLQASSQEVFIEPPLDVDPMISFRAYVAKGMRVVWILQ